jgi:hypothetical protein
MASSHGEVFLTPPDLAERWQIPVSRLANWRSEGTGPRYLKIEGLVRYRLSDVEEFEHTQSRVSL